jgi:hypothetical protein
MFVRCSNKISREGANRRAPSDVLGKARRTYWRRQLLGAVLIDASRQHRRRPARILEANGHHRGAAVVAREAGRPRMALKENPPQRGAWSFGYVRYVR